MISCNWHDSINSAGNHQCHGALGPKCDMYAYVFVSFFIVLYYTCIHNLSRQLPLANPSLRNTLTRCTGRSALSNATRVVTAMSTLWRLCWQIKMRRFRYWWVNLIGAVYKIPPMSQPKVSPTFALLLAATSAAESQRWRLRTKRLLRHYLSLPLLSLQRWRSLCVAKLRAGLLGSTGKRTYPSSLRNKFGDWTKKRLTASPGLP